MTLIDMKLKKKSKKEIKEACIPMYSEETDQWPYGLQIRFETEQIKNLPDLIKKKVGDKCMIYAEGTVTATRESERQSGDKSQSVELQIEKIDVRPKITKAIKDMNPKEFKEFRESGSKY